ncbi:MAG: ELWxxDGT repeat protein [Bacillota bacterium]
MWEAEDPARRGCAEHWAGEACIEALESRCMLSGVRLVADVNVAPEMSHLSPVASLNGSVFCIRDDYPGDTENPGQRDGLWKTDGTAKGTSLVWEGRVLTAASFGKYVYFITDWGELWRTDGKSDGTVLVEELGPGAVPGYAEIAVLEDRMLIQGPDYRLWASDGTSKGTVLYDGPIERPTSIARLSGTTVFESYDEAHGGELWASRSKDLGGGELLLDINRGQGSSSLALLVHVGKAVLFGADDGKHGRELWRTDGTSKGTYLVKDIYAGKASAGVYRGVELNGCFVFAADDGVHGTELWRSDGTAAGTTLVRDLVGGATGSDPESFVRVGRRVFFTAGNALWVTNGSAKGTKQVRSFDTTVESGVGKLVAAGEKVFFNVYSSWSVAQMWVSDGTSAGTVPVNSLSAAMASSAPQDLIDVNGMLLFRGYDDVHGWGLWKTNGTAKGTRFLKGLSTNYLGRLDPWVTTGFKGQLYFSQRCPNASIWYTDGTVKGTRLVKDFFDLSGLLVEMNGALYFGAKVDRERGPEGLWKTDGTEAGTVLVSEMPLPAVFARVGNTIFFEGRDEAHGAELWASDGTAEGTRMVRDLRPGPESCYVSRPIAYQGKLFFGTWDSDERIIRLWQSDGTKAGTNAFYKITAGCDIGAVVECNGLLYFMIYKELWRTDGTAAGTFRVSEACDEQTPRVYRGRVYFWRPGPNGSIALWQTDGTPAGTKLVKETEYGSTYWPPAELTVAGNRLYFVATDSKGGRELWQSDGTAKGTYRVADVWPGRISSNPHSLFNFGNTLYFVGNDGAHGEELYRLL